MKEKVKKEINNTYAQAIKEGAEQVAQAQAYRETPKPNAEDFLNKRNEIKK